MGLLSGVAVEIVEGTGANRENRSSAVACEEHCIQPHTGERGTVIPSTANALRCMHP